MERVEKNGEQPRGKSVATILAIGTANPPDFILQSDYPDFHFKDVKINSSNAYVCFLHYLCITFSVTFFKIIIIFLLNKFNVTFWIDPISKRLNT
jgi:hypothetical protein